MWRAKSILLPTLLLSAVLFGTATGRADEEPAPIKLTLHPADEPKPALKYRLLPPFLETTPGNAAVYYGKVKSEQRQFFSSRELWENMERWRELPLKELRTLVEFHGDDIRVPTEVDIAPPGVDVELHGDDIRVPTIGNIDDSLSRGGRCRTCNWQLPIGDVPFYDLLLPQAQELRQFGRILATKARLQLARGDFDSAIMTLQSGYALGRHAAAGETLVNGLVGIGICHLMSDQLREHAQLPDAPNLYWALTDLPRPLIDLRRAYEVEAQGVALNFPEIPDLSSAELSEDAWRNMLSQLVEGTILWNSTDQVYIPPASDALDRRCQQLRTVAEQALIESGFKEDQVEAMSLHHISVLYTVTRHRLLLEQAIKYVSLPFPQAMAGIDAAIEQAKQEQHIVPIAPRTGPGMRGPRIAIARLERQIAVLRVIEALRIFGARHQGQLPERLEDITAVPVPFDPVTGQAFIYLRDGEKAMLRGPALRNTSLNYEIEMVRTQE